ncbi:MAG: leucine-rich repeat protein [Rikenellaceae bacterium]
MKKTILTAGNSTRPAVGALAAALSLLTIACSTDTEQATPGQSGDSNLTTVTIGATISEDDTVSRVDIDGYTTKWSASGLDFLYVYGAEEVFSSTTENKTINATFTGELDLTTAQKLYAVCDYDNGSSSYLTENVDGQKEYKMILDTAQDQSTYVTEGNVNTGSIGAEVILYGVSDSEVSSDNATVSMTMKHATAVQDFDFTNIPSADHGLISNVEFISSEPFLSLATLNLDEGTVTPVEYAAESISVAVNVKNLASSELMYTKTTMTVRVAMLPQTVAATAEWSLLVTLYDGTQYTYDFGAGSEPYTYAAGDCASIAVDFEKMTEVEADEIEGVLVTLQDVSDENTAGFDTWSVSCGTVASADIAASDMTQLFEVLAAAVAADRDIKLIFTDLTGTTTLFSENTDITVVEFPAVTAMGSNSGFKSCTNLRSVSAPLCTKFHNLTFTGCTNLEYVYAPIVNTINKNAFNECTSLKTLEIASSGVSSLTIGENIFLNADLSDVDLTTGIGSKSQNEDGVTWDWIADDSNTFTGFKSITIVE